MGHPAIRPVSYEPPPGVTGEIELTTLARMRERAGPHGFRTPQRLDFDILLRIDAGTASHTVDFTDFPLGPGDVLWIRAGQVHQWGAIAAIDGPVALFTPAAIDSGSRERIGAAGVGTPNHWPAPLLAGMPARIALAAVFATDPTQTPLPTGTGRPNALTGGSTAPDVSVAVAPTPLVVSTAEPATTAPGRGRAGSTPDSLSGNATRDAARAHLLAGALLLLALAATAGDDRAAAPTREAFVWFRDEVEKTFATRHKVADYAARLGYSTRTLNRLARENTGLSAKQLIDERIVLEAKRLLVHGKEPVARIAERLGFDDPSNFSKYFQQRAGVTPLGFRERAVSAAPE
ncbi:AraC family transcriptional regulator [Nocardia yamanashiensis]|uniref:AraC family transcriptional regulator n=1 Tax=Nocardia yamanashiensis TaxID=209247 RepID=UPI001C3F5E9F|nr:AraC family transcriptional regulator [Nocardia yamanashiensis]